jgi:hypothetical protein
MSELHWKKLYDYWLSKHDGGRPPSRGDIDPVIDIPKLAKNLMLLDVGNGFTFRLVGSEIAHRHGFDMTGQRAGTSGKAPEAVDEWKAALDYVSRELKPRLLASRIGKNEIAQNVMLILPLVDRQGKIEMILGGSFYNEHFKPGTHIDDMVAREVPEE